MDPTTIPIHDIHLPARIGWWPPAPGWWLLALAIIVVAVLTVRRLLHRPPTPARQRALLSAAIREHWRGLRSTYGAHAGDVDPAGVRELSAFLRRVALSLHPRESVAGLSGEAWLAFLDQTIQGSDFRQGIGRLLLEAPYRRPGRIAAAQWQALVELCDRWVEKTVQSGGEAAR